MLHRKVGDNDRGGGRKILPNPLKNTPFKYAGPNNIALYFFTLFSSKKSILGPNNCAPGPGKFVHQLCIRNIIRGGGVTARALVIRPIWPVVLGGQYEATTAISPWGVYSCGR